MKVLAINGSPRKDGNTARMLGAVLTICKNSGCETELFQAGGREVRGCMACLGCRENKNACVIDDWMNELYLKMLHADAIILGSPTYFSDITPEIKAVMDRCGYISRNAGSSFSRKIGAAVCAARRAGALHTLNTMQHFFYINDMVQPGSSYWNMSLSRNLGDFERDEEGINTMNRLGENIVWLLQRLSG